MLPQAWQLAKRRAASFANELGVTLESNYQSLDLNPKPDGHGGCGVPKWPGIPITASVSETYTIRSGPASMSKTPPSAAVELASYELAPFAMRPPLVPQKPKGARVIAVKAIGWATLNADIVDIELQLQPKEPATTETSGVGPKSDADIEPLLSTIRTALTDADIQTRYEPMHYGFGNSPVIIDQYRADVHVRIPHPSQHVIDAAVPQILAAAAQLNLDLRGGARNYLSACEPIEDAARRNGIARAQAQAFALVRQNQNLRLIFADEQFLRMRGDTICGPVIDTSLGWTSTRSGLVPPPVSASALVPIQLEYAVDH
jgi:hypothetical protein